MLSPIFTGFNEDRGRSGAVDMCVNLYPEMTEGSKGPEIGLLISSPGLTTALATLGAGPVRGAFTGKDNLLYVASGNGFYSVTPGFASTLLGNLASLSGPVSIIENPTQVLVVDGVGGWVWNRQTAAYTQVIPNADTSDTGPNSAVYQDGFGIVNSAGSNQVYQSNFNDLSKFATPVGGGGSTPNNAFIQGNPQDVLTMFELKEEVFMLKQKAIEVWINQGSPGFAFVQLQGVYFPVGVLAPASVARIENGIAWLGSSAEGEAIVYRSVGYQERSITPHALAEEWQGYAVKSDAIGYSYQSVGHYFYVLTFPTEGTSWAFDLTTNRWHQRAYFSNGVFQRELANCHALFNGRHIVGDYRNGNLYALDDETFTDAGARRRWLRSWRAIPASMPQGVPMSFDSLQILLETGITIGPSANPVINLRFSDDGGYTWAGPFQVPAGKIGETAWRAIQNRLGSTTLGRGLDRVWEISGDDPMKVKIVGAEWTGGPS